MVTTSNRTPSLSPWYTIIYIYKHEKVNTSQQRLTSGYGINNYLGCAFDMFSGNWEFLQKKTPSQNSLVGGLGQWITVSKNNHLSQCRFHINLKVLQSLYHGQSFFLYSGIFHLVFVKPFGEETYRMVQSIFVFLEQHSSSSHITGIHSQL